MTLIPYMKYLLCLPLLALAVACSSSVSEALDEAESLVNDRPDSALAVLGSLDPDVRLSPGDEARHSLLLSMALHKSGVDVGSDSIIAPAVRYYSRRGDSDHKLKAYYYQGLAAYYAGDDEAAMESFANASLHLGGCSDMAAAGRLHIAKKQLYMRRYDYEEAAVSAHAAAVCFDACGDTSSYISALLSVLNAGIMSGSPENAEDELACLDEFRPLMTRKQLSSYHSHRLRYIMRTDPDEVASCVSQAVYELGEGFVDWAAAASAYCSAGDYHSAHDILSDRDLKMSGIYGSIGLSGLKARVFHGLGLYEEAAGFYAEYSSRLDSLNMTLIRSRVPYVHDRLLSELRILGMSRSILALLLAVSLLVIAVMAVASAAGRYAEARRREKERAESLLEAAEAEIGRLKRLRKTGRLDEEARRLVDERLSILNRYVGRAISSNAFRNGGDDELRRIMEDRGMFLESTWRSFAVTNPGFIAYLQDCGLNSREVGCCCLMCIGLRGNEIASYLKITDRSYYNFTVNIRKKLGLDRNGDSLGRFLCRKIKSVP